MGCCGSCGGEDSTPPKEQETDQIKAQDQDKKQEQAEKETQAEKQE